MPRRDGTGPRGLGSMTGRARGFCAGFDSPGYLNRGGLGLGWRMRQWGDALRCRARGAWEARNLGAAPDIPLHNEREFWQNRVAAMQEEIDALKKRMAQMEGKSI